MILSAWRSWRGARGVALLAIVAFTVGIGSATAIFTVINGVMLKPLAVPTRRALRCNLRRPDR